MTSFSFSTPTGQAAAFVTSPSPGPLVVRAGTASAPVRRARASVAAVATAVATAAILFAGSTMAQDWPGNKPIRVLVGYPPGGGVDFTARTIQPVFEKVLGTQMILDYKPGASGTIAASELARAAPDGHTLLLANTGPFAIAPHLQRKPPYDPVTQFTYVGQISEGSYVAVTRADHPANDLKAFVAWAKARPGAVNFASGGIGTSTHLNGELLNQVAGLDMIHVPYKGSAPAIQEMIGGQTQLLIDAGTVLIPQIKGGKLKALAVTGSQRDPALPDVATTRELGLGDFEAVGFQGVVAPAGLPVGIRDRIASAVRAAVENAEVQAKLVGAGSQPRYRPPGDFAAFVGAENAKWTALIRERGLRAD